MTNAKQAAALKLSTKIAAMSEEQKEARVQELYAVIVPTPDEVEEFTVLMFGGAAVKKTPPIK
jgi:hypothetical protein